MNVQSATESFRRVSWLTPRLCGKHISIYASRRTVLTAPRVARALVWHPGGQACSHTSPQRRTVWIVPSAQFAWRSSRSGTPWQDWNVSAGFTRTAFRGGLPKIRAGVRYTSTLFHEQVLSRKLISTRVDTHAWTLKDVNRGERARYPRGKLCEIRRLVRDLINPLYLPCLDSGSFGALHGVRGCL